MKVLVTGGGGHLGRVVCGTLAEAGHDVLAVDRAWHETPVRLEVVDLLDLYATYRLAEGCDAVVHLANHTRVSGHMPRQQTYTENVTLDMNVFQAAVERGVRRLVFASSVQVVGGRRGGLNDAERPSCLPYLPMDGDLPAQPGNAYALSKQAGEEQLRFLAAEQEDLSCTAIRFPWVVDERYARWVTRTRNDMEHYWGNLDEGFSYLAITDAASLVRVVLERQTPGYHCLLPAAPDNQLGKPIPELIARFFPNVPLRMPAEQMEALVDISAITDSLGWRPEAPPLHEMRAP